MPYASGTWGEKAKARAKTRNEYFKIYKRNRDKTKVRARGFVQYALGKGKIVRGTCEVANCGIEKTEAHHEDYEKPLDIIWLCPKHHREADRKLGLRK